MPACCGAPVLQGSPIFILFPRGRKCAFIIMLALMQTHTHTWCESSQAVVSVPIAASSFTASSRQILLRKKGVGGALLGDSQEKLFFKARPLARTHTRTHAFVTRTHAHTLLSLSLSLSFLRPCFFFRQFCSVTHRDKRCGPLVSSAPVFCDKYLQRIPLADPDPFSDPCKFSTPQISLLWERKQTWPTFSGCLSCKR